MNLLQHLLRRVLGVPLNPPRVTGVIYRTSRAYAWARVEAGETVFVHRAELEGEPRALRLGDRLSFEVDRSNPRGPKGLNVRLESGRLAAVAKEI